MNKKKICIITSTRAEYGLLSRLMKEINENSQFELQIIASGTHLIKKYGATINEIKSDNFHINKKIDLKLISDSPVAVSKSMALGIEKISQAFHHLEPDLILILGDRFEILSSAIAAAFHKIPIAHIHGGELTEGALDDAFRHCITKLSHLHFVASEVYKKRVIQLGENPKFVFNVGGLGVDNIKKIRLMKRREVESYLRIKFYNKNLLITYHPETLSEKAPRKDMIELLAALNRLKDTRLIFTMPNADIGNLIIIDLIKKFCNKNKDACFFTSMGHVAYLSCMSQVDAVIGNSSSGILEAPSFKKATINIGQRQKGRLQANSIINVNPVAKDIYNSILSIYHINFQKKVAKTSSPYGNGGAVQKIMKILKKVNLKNIESKSFYDLVYPNKK